MNVSKFSFLIFMVSLLSGIFAFKAKENTPLPTRLRITVIDGLGNVVEGATVSIYSLEESYRSNTDAVATSTTNEKGQVTFKDLQPISYYIDARKEDQNNDAEGVKTAPLEEGKLNKVNTVIN